MIFPLFVSVWCVWVFSLPIFPSQDGPAHSYYVQILSRLITHSSQYSGFFFIRHYLPPYALHYYLLLAGAELFSFPIAEKLMVCAIIVCTAFGFRYFASAIGPNADLVSIWIVPLLLHWTIYMGFFNYSLALAISLWALGLWCRATGEQRRSRWILFLALVAVLMLTHPVPLFLVVSFCALDLVIRILQSEVFSQPRGVKTGMSPFRKHIRGIIYFLIAASSLGYVALYFDHTRSGSSIVREMSFHKAVLLACLRLTTLSPFGSSHPLALLYRAGLYSILAYSLFLASRGLLGRWRHRKLNRADEVLVSTIILMLMIPLLPSRINGSTLFPHRLLILVWLGAVAAAGGIECVSRRTRALSVAATCCLLGVGVGLAQLQIAPVAHRLAELRDLRLPNGQKGLVINDPMIRVLGSEDTSKLNFDPYWWSGVLPFARADAILLNSPWLDLTIIPLAGSPELFINHPVIRDLIGRAVVDNPYEMFKGIQASAIVRDKVLTASDFVLVQSVASGNVEYRINSMLGRPYVYAHHCTVHEWYVLCTMSPTSAP